MRVKILNLLLLCAISAISQNPQEKAQSIFYENIKLKAQVQNLRAYYTFSNKVIMKFFEDYFVEGLKIQARDKAWIKLVCGVTYHPEKESLYLWSDNLSIKREVEKMVGAHKIYKYTPFPERNLSDGIASFIGAKSANADKAKENFDLYQTFITEQINQERKDKELRGFYYRYTYNPMDNENINSLSDLEKDNKTFKEEIQYLEKCLTDKNQPNVKVFVRRIQKNLDVKSQDIEKARQALKVPSDDQESIAFSKIKATSIQYNWENNNLFEKAITDKQYQKMWMENVVVPPTNDSVKNVEINFFKLITQEQAKRLRQEKREGK